MLVGCLDVLHLTLIFLNLCLHHHRGTQESESRFSA
jgi:hypothetical protein